MYLINPNWWQYCRLQTLCTVLKNAKGDWRMQRSLTTRSICKSVMKEMAFGQSWEANWLFLQSLLDVYRIENVTQVSLMPWWKGCQVGMEVIMPHSCHLSVCDHEQCSLGILSSSKKCYQIIYRTIRFAFCMIPGSPRVRGDGLGRKEGKESANSSLNAFTICEPPLSGSTCWRPHTEVCQSDMRGVYGWSWQEEERLI